MDIAQKRDSSEEAADLERAACWYAGLLVSFKQHIGSHCLVHGVSAGAETSMTVAGKKKASIH